MPQQALALANSEIAVAQARILTKDLSARIGVDNSRFIAEAFLRILARRPTPQEQKLCLEFVGEQLRLHSSPVPASGTVVVNSGLPLSGQKARDAATTLPPAPSVNITVQHAREHLVLVLFNHNDFITIR